MSQKNLKDIIFETFIEVNTLETIPDFKSRSKRYRGLDPEGSLMTREQITRTYIYEGFVDGYQGKLHKNKGPKGIAESFKGDTLDKVLDEFEGAFLEAFGEALEEIPSRQYDAGYSLGVSARGGVKDAGFKNN